MFGQSLLSAFGIACTTDTDQLFVSTTSTTSLATYQLNNATTSIPSNTYPGTASNITYGTGKFGNAASFNGSSSYIRLPANFLNSSTQTISAWVNPSSLSANGIIYSSYDYQTGPSKGTYMRVNSGGQIQLTVHDGDCSTMYPANPSCTGVTQLISPSSITVNTWTHVVGVIGGSGNPMAIYINGVKVISTATMRSVGYWSGKQPLIGATDYVVNGTSYPAEYYFNGSIDQVRFFSSALPQSAITALYNETTTTAQSASVDYVDTNPNSVAYYKMSDATDQLGNNNGTATNVNFNTEGKFGFAGGFSSISYMDVPISLTPPTSSLSLWFKTSQNDTNWRIIADAGGSYSSGTGYAIFVSGDGGYINLYFTNGQTGQSQLLIGTTVINDGNWHNVVLSMASNNTFVLYLDGTSHLSGTRTRWTQGDTSSVSSLRLANNASSTSSGNQFIGDIDQIRIYDSAISAANASTLYKEVECEPAAINALANFNSVLYTGNNTTNIINTVGFEPGLLWVKTRDDNKNHVLVDTVRGISSVLEADTTAAAVTGYTDVTSFDSNGFTLGATSAVYMNPAGIDMVSWNWKAPLANLSTSFNGSSSYITISGLSSMFSTKATFTVSLWFKTTATGNRALFDDYTSNNYNIQLYLYDGILNVATRFSGGDSNMTASSTTYNDGNWHYVAVTSNQTTYNTYVDGGSPITWTASSNSHSGQTPTVTTGASQGGAVNFFNGDIAQLRIFNDTLTASEVADLYAEPAASNNTLNYPAGAGCIAAYPLQTDAVDLSGNYSGASSNVTFGQPGYLTSNTDGTITSTVAANTEAGFSIVKWKGIASAATVGHGLGKIPELIIAKNIDTANSWAVYSEPTTINYYLELNSNSSKSQLNNYWGASAPTSTVFGLYNGASNINRSGESIIAYCFTSIPGYSKIGSYVGNGSSQTLYTSFAVKFVLIKSTTSSQNWMIYDSTRGGNKYLIADLADAEGTSGSNLVTFNSNGFSVSNSNSENQSGQTFIFLAIA